MSMLYVLVEDPREGSEVFLVTSSEEIAVRGAIEILRQNFMPEDPDDEGHIWYDYKEFDAELSKLGEASFWAKYSNAWGYNVCSIWPMYMTG